jgi:hypothetical protein
MEVAARSYLAADVAVVGASVIAVSPVVPKPDVQIPIPHVSASVELAALENPREVIAKLVQQSIDNAGALGGKVLADPLPILQQIFTNQMGNASSLAGALGTFIANTTTAITQDVPQQLQLAQEAFEQGHITDGLNDLVGAVLLPILGSGLSNLEVFQDIFNVIRNPVQNVLNIIDAGPTILGDGGRFRHCRVLTHLPASPTMPTGTAPDRLTFCTLGPAATIVVSCRIGSTVAMFHSRGSTASITSPMSSVPSSAASIFG